MSDQLDAVERMAKEALADLQRDYQMRAQPYIDMLCKIEALKPALTFVVSMEDMERFLITPGKIDEHSKRN